jgi:hypothetical protein
MFKKARGRPVHSRKRDHSDDSSEEDLPGDNDKTTDGTTLEQRIAQVKRKRQLLTEIQYKRGLDPNQVVTSSSTAATATTDSDIPLNAEEGPSWMPSVEGSKEGILEQKHREAMESFIRNRMNTDDNKSSADDNLNNNPSNQISHNLYRELAATAAQLGGTVANAVATTESSQHDDVGTGGALVAGTGIAEVILPESNRVLTAQATQQLLRERYKSRKVDPLLAKRPTSLPGLPNRFTVATAPISHTTGPHATDNHRVASHNPTESIYDSNETVEQAVDDDRIGFERLKRIRDGRPSRPFVKKHDKSSDDRVYKQFMTKQRDQNFRGR